MWRLEISLFGILFAVIFAEVTVVPSIWTPLRVDFFIGMIIGQIIYMPFSRGFPFVIISALILEAFSGARIGLISLLYILAFLAVDMLKSIVYLENIYTQIIIGFVLYLLMVLATMILVDIGAPEEKAIGMIVGAFFSGLVTPVMVYMVYRLKTAYEQ